MLKQFIHFFYYLFAIFFLVCFEIHAGVNSGLGPVQDSAAYKQYVLRSNPSELSKLIYLMDRFQGAKDLEVSYEGNFYDIETARREARQYIAKNYRQETAGRFIQDHAYRPKFGNGILYVKYPDGTTRPLRDILLEELKVLENLKQ